MRRSWLGVTHEFAPRDIRFLTRLKERGATRDELETVFLLFALFDAQLDAEPEAEPAEEQLHLLEVA